ncbi:MAG TPA: DUF4249 domain-containing protein [Cyclobacteriaceae bacterium]|nr:DUF4249 domain-containing protein [Cyclobacteriaceae bacterium]
MRRYFKSFFLFIFIAGCIEPYDFLIENVRPGVVIEAHLSDKSFHETQLYPSDGIYPSVRLTRTGDVTNSQAETISGALVELIDDQGAAYSYTEQGVPGVYILSDADFHAVTGVRYKLRVSIEGEAEIESSWEKLPGEQGPIGTVGFHEVVRPMYKYEAGEQVVKDVKGIESYITVPPNTSEDPVYYRWSFEPLFVFVAPLAPTSKCWIRNSPYLSEYAVREDYNGGYEQPLFFMETIRNHRIYNEFSALIRQHVLSREHFYFWKEMQERNQGGFLQDTPPYNLKTNFKVNAGDVAAFGYFAPVRETALRWYLVRSDLSYAVEDTGREDCLAPKMGMAPQCLDCRAYEWGGESTNMKPEWWR